MRMLDPPFNKTIFTPIHTQFLQPLGWTSSLQTVTPDKDTPSRSYWPKRRQKKILNSKLRQEPKMAPQRVA